MAATEPGLRPGDVVETSPAGGVQWLIADRKIEGVTFRGLGDAWGWLRFRNCELVDCTFERCRVNWDFGGRPFEQDAASLISSSRFIRCDLRQFQVAYGGVEHSLFQNCRWDFPNFLHHTDLVENRFVGIVRRLIIWGKDVAETSEVLQPRSRPNVISGNDFRDADLRELELRYGVPVAEQMWPHGQHCGVIDRYPERIDAVAAHLNHRHDQDADRWRIWLSTLAIHHGLDTDQQTMWDRWDDPSKSPVHNAVLAALAALELPHRSR